MQKSLYQATNRTKLIRVVQEETGDAISSQHIKAILDGLGLSTTIRSVSVTRSRARKVTLRDESGNVYHIPPRKLRLYAAS